MKTLTLAAKVELQAGAAGKRARLKIVAYNGGTMYVDHWGPVAIELSGIAIQAQTPILLSHENTLDALVGQGLAKVVDGSLIVDAVFLPGLAGEKLETLLAAGASLQASVGVSPTRTSYVRKSGEVKVNGKPVAEGVTIIHAGSLREVSILPLGADKSTSVSLAARAAGVSRMKFNAWVQSIGIDPANIPQQNLGQLQASHAQLYPPADQPASTGELETILAKSAEPLLVRAMAEGWTAKRAKDEALTFIRASRPVINGASKNGRNDGVMGADHLAAGLMVRAGYHDAAEKAYGPAVMEQSRKLHSASFLDLCKASLAIEGKEVPVTPDGIIRASLSTSSLPVALGSSADKILESTWRESTPTWRSFCAIRNAPNFREQTSLRPTFAGDLEVVGDGGEIPHGSISESTFAWRVATYAKRYKIGRQQVVNDDLSVFSELIPGLSKAAMRTLSDLVYTKLLLNTGSFFHANNANLVSGGGTELSTTSLGVAVRKLRIQKDPDNNNLDMQPAVLVVPPELEVTARGLLQSAEVLRVTTDGLPTGNVHQGLCKLEIEPRLSNSAFTNYSTTAWYLFASPSDVPMVVGYLDGRQTPVVESFGLNHEVGVLAFQYRVYHDFGAAFGDYRAAQKSAGA